MVKVKVRCLVNVIFGSQNFPSYLLNKIKLQLSINTSLENDEAKACDEALAIGHTIAANNLLAWIQVMRLKLDANLSFVVVNICNHAFLVGKSDALD